MKNYIKANKGSGSRPDMAVYDIIKDNVSDNSGDGVFAEWLHEFDSGYSSLEYALCAMAHSEDFSVYWTTHDGYWGTEDYLILPKGMSIEYWAKIIWEDLDAQGFDESYVPDLSDFIWIS